MEMSCTRSSDDICQNGSEQFFYCETNPPQFALPPPPPKSLWQRAQNIFRCVGPQPSNFSYQNFCGNDNERSLVLETSHSADEGSFPTSFNRSHAPFSTCATSSTGTKKQSLLDHHEQHERKKEYLKQDLCESDGSQNKENDGDNFNPEGRPHLRTTEIPRSRPSREPLVRCPPFAVPVRPSARRTPHLQERGSTGKHSLPPAELRELWGDHIVKELFPSVDEKHQSPTATSSSSNSSSPVPLLLAEDAPGFVDVPLSDDDDKKGGSATCSEETKLRPDDSSKGVRAFTLYRNSLAQLAASSTNCAFAVTGSWGPASLGKRKKSIA